MRGLLRNTLVITSALIIFSTTQTMAKESFRVCADPLHPPYSDKNGNGFENEIAELFARDMGQTVEYYWFPQRIGFIRNTLKARLPDSEQYKCDVVMGVPASFDFTLTSNPYYHSTYMLLIAKGRGWDDIDTAEQLTNLPIQRQESMRIAMFDRGPGTAWLQKNGLLNQGIPYQTMTGDHENNTAMMIEKELKAGKVDMVILWGPMAGYILSQSPEGSYAAIPMQSIPGMKFDFSIAMGIRYGDKTRQEQLNNLITKNKEKIEAILTRYKVPLLPIPKLSTRADDDD